MSTILVIEPEFLIRCLLMKVLRLAGYRAQGVASRAEALAFLQTQPVHLILSDWRQGDQQNHALCREIRQASTAPILMLASSNRKDELQHCLDLGVNDYIVKPFALAEVRRRVRGLLNNRQRIVKVLDERTQGNPIDPSSYAQSVAIHDYQ